MQRKIFIGIDLPAQVRKRLAEKLEKWADLPVRWVDKSTYHVTLLFLGHVEEDRVLEICALVRAAVETQPIFEVALEKIAIGPDLKKPNLIWATGAASAELRELYESIEKSLDMFKVSKKEFRPHVTLGRIRARKWSELPTPPSVEEKINLVVPVDSVQIFESKVEQGKTKFEILDSCPLE